MQSRLNDQVQENDQLRRQISQPRAQTQEMKQEIGTTPATADGGPTDTRQPDAAPACQRHGLSTGPRLGWPIAQRGERGDPAWDAVAHVCAAVEYVVWVSV
ncbi:hypothetical protein DL765_000171 [Monosporascus sp. GIB2]|nr:hypothetical protein DL765_000171 [Monosporascus sp. GIB2]